MLSSRTKLLYLNLYAILLHILQYLKRFLCSSSMKELKNQSGMTNEMYVRTTILCEVGKTHQVTLS